MQETKQSGLTEVSIPLQAAAYDIWDKKYRLKDQLGQPMDQDPDATLERVARALSELEATPEKRAHWYDEFLWALQNGAIPAGRILSNTGTQACKDQTSTINCTVSGIIHDRMDSILGRLHEAGLTLKSGCGIGYEFSTLRPKGAFVNGAGAHTSGPLSFMEIYDSMCLTISSSGGRRGAQMATFDIGHPDALEFIRAKRESGRLRHFNLSLLITEEFMQAVEADASWSLAFPVSRQEAARKGYDLNDSTAFTWRDWPCDDGYILNEAGLVACKIEKTLPARRLWDLIMSSTYDYAEPGFILIDRVNDLNNNWFCEAIRATNPCGEQPLPPFGACLLGSINLTRFITAPFADNARFDWERFRRVVRIFTRMLDNVVEINGLPLPEQREEIIRKRRHGMGFLGLGSALTMLKMKYGETDAVSFTNEVSRELACVGWQAALELAREKGPAPVMEEEFIVTASMLKQRPEMVRDGYREGDSIKGAELHARYSRYMQKLARLIPECIDELAKTGARFTHHSSIAPTGTISLSMGNNVSNGIEPSFAHRYSRNIIREGKKTKEKVEVLSYEFLAYRELLDPDATEETLPDFFISSEDVLPEQHVEMQAAAQEWIDSSISKTVNVPRDLPFDKFKDVYWYAYRQGLKGCTTFRFNPEHFQGVLVRDRDLENTLYRFVLNDGTSIELHGNEEVEYEGETHTAANLYDALKEGYYGRY